MIFASQGAPPVSLKPGFPRFILTSGINSRMTHNSMNAKKRRNKSHRRDVNISGNTKSRTRATAKKPIAAWRHNRRDANNVEILGSEQMSTTAGPQHQNATSAKNSRAVVQCIYYIVKALPIAARRRKTVHQVCRSGKFSEFRSAYSEVQYLLWHSNRRSQ